MNLVGASYQYYCQNLVTTNRAEKPLMSFIKATWSYNGDVIRTPQIIHNLIGSLFDHIAQFYQL